MEGQLVRVAILGASGYTGFELIRILLYHPKAKITFVSSRSQEKTSLSEHYPPFKGIIDICYSTVDVEKIAEASDIVFTALPHGASMDIVPQLLERGLRVVDLSADYRLRDARVYQEWYGQHRNPDLLTRSVYGLPELYRGAIKRADLVANPGCYPTSIILALAPLLKYAMIELDSIISDSKSGVTGAGRGLSLTTHFCEVNESFKAYKVGGVHRHIPEIEQELSVMAGREVKIVFTPHLVPMSRGILSTVYVIPKEGVGERDVEEAFKTFYRDEPFIRIFGSEAETPSTLQVRGSNYCDIGWRFDKRTGKLIVVSAIDNLTRGASGQAVWNMNLMVGLPETMGFQFAPWQP
ncbi:MAG: N-acetyl-gamma-glutamyl-phosphate reductase [Syntrophobacterales bacterium]|nr:N-acetyl-gamma-glutamyl-phosphate reductase [Syntrophobacterales bacterium]